MKKGIKIIISVIRDMYGLMDLITLTSSTQFRHKLFYMIQHNVLSIFIEINLVCKTLCIIYCHNHSSY